MSPWYAFTVWSLVLGSLVLGSLVLGSLILGQHTHTHTHTPKFWSLYSVEPHPGAHPRGSLIMGQHLSQLSPTPYGTFNICLNPTVPRPGATHTQTHTHTPLGASSWGASSRGHTQGEPHHGAGAFTVWSLILGSIF